MAGESEREDGTIVRTYTTLKSYQQDRRALAREGWHVASTLERAPRVGGRRILGFTFGTPTIDLVATYARGPGRRPVANPWDPGDDEPAAPTPEAG